MRLQCSRSHVFGMLSFAMMQFSGLLANTCDSGAVYDVIEDCVAQNVPRILSPAGYKRTASLIQSRISAECGSRQNVTTCVENQFNYCQNKANILKVLGKRYRVCEGGLPIPWITKWVKSNPSAKLSYACSDAIRISAPPVINIGMEDCHRFEIQYDAAYTGHESLTEFTALIERLLSNSFTCLSKMYKDIAPVINMEPACVDFGNWNNVMTLMTLTLQSQSPEYFAVLPDNVLAAIKKNAAS